MKLSVGLTLIILPFTSQAGLVNETRLNTVSMTVCSAYDETSCIKLSGERADVSGFTGNLQIKNPKVEGLNLNKKTFSSAVVDFQENQITLRERVDGELIGEWQIETEKMQARFFKGL